MLGQLPERTDSTHFVELTDPQRRPYDEQKTNLARFLTKPVLNDLDRKRILASIVNMRLICDSTFLFDKSGVLKREWRGVKVKEHAAEVLAAVKAL